MLEFDASWQVDACLLRFTYAGTRSFICLHPTAYKTGETLVLGIGEQSIRLVPTVIPRASNADHGCACCSLPFDFVKTRIQKMEKGPDGKYPYNGPVDCAMQTFRKEGPLKFYTGFPTYCIRCARTLHVHRTVYEGHCEGIVKT